MSSPRLGERGAPNESAESDLLGTDREGTGSKGNLARGSGEGSGGRGGRSPAVGLLVWDSSLESPPASLVCLVAATRTPGHDAASGDCGRGGAGAAERPAAEGESHPEPGHRGADHQHRAVQPAEPEETSRAAGEGLYVAPLRAGPGLSWRTVVAAAQEADGMVSGSAGGESSVCWALGKTLLVLFTSAPKLPRFQHWRPAKCRSQPSHKGPGLYIPIWQEPHPPRLPCHLSLARPVPWLWREMSDAVGQRSSRRIHCSLG